MKIKDSTKCPVCNGSGLLETPYKNDIDLFEVKKEMAMKLRDKGYSLRQIQKALGYKSHRSIQHFLK